MVKREYTGPEFNPLGAAMAEHVAGHMAANDYSWWHEARGQADGLAGKARSMAGFTEGERWSYLNGYQYGFRVRRGEGRNDGWCLYRLGKAMHHPRIPQVPFVLYG